MTHNLEKGELNAWLERFNFFNDAVFKWLTAQYTEDQLVLEVGIETQDSQDVRTGWSLVTLRMQNCELWSFSESSKISYQVLSNGLHVIIEAGRVGVEFGHFIDLPESLDELSTSPCCIVAKSCFWSAAQFPTEIRRKPGTV